MKLGLKENLVSFAVLKRFPRTYRKCRFLSMARDNFSTKAKDHFKICDIVGVCMAGSYIKSRFWVLAPPIYRIVTKRSWKIPPYSAMFTLRQSESATCVGVCRMRLHAYHVIFASRKRRIWPCVWVLVFIEFFLVFFFFLMAPNL